MASLQDVAHWLGTGDVQAMAKDLGLKPPISLLALIEAFVQDAPPKVPVPKAPVSLSPSGDNVPIFPVLLTWSDPGAGKRWRAASFGVEFFELPSQGPELELLNVGVSGPSIIYPHALKHDTRYLLNVWAVNRYGSSGTASTVFHTVS